jgi:hypothetical protein
MKMWIIIFSLFVGVLTSDQILAKQSKKASTFTKENCDRIQSLTLLLPNTLYLQEIREAKISDDAVKLANRYSQGSKSFVGEEQDVWIKLEKDQTQIAAAMIIKPEYQTRQMTFNSQTFFLGNPYLNGIGMLPWSNQYFSKIKYSPYFSDVIFSQAYLAIHQKKIELCEKLLKSTAENQDSRNSGKELKADPEFWGGEGKRAPAKSQ